jgi:hypothetical protein
VRLLKALENLAAVAAEQGERRENRSGRLTALRRREGCTSRWHVRTGHHLVFYLLRQAAQHTIDVVRCLKPEVIVDDPVELLRGPFHGCASIDIACLLLLIRVMRSAH